jgi:starch synthase
VCKQALLNTFDLPEKSSHPVIAVTSRFDNQKGFDLIAEIFEKLLAHDLILVLAGTGHEKYQKLVRHMAEKYPQKVSVRFDTDDSLKHMIIAGADMLLMPSKQEPGGSEQLYALRYGTVPIVRSTGVLKDTVQPFEPESDTGTGITFLDYSAEQLLEAIHIALNTYRDQKSWQALILRGMQEDFSWNTSASAYEQLYQKATERIHA